MTLIEEVRFRAEAPAPDAARRIREAAGVSQVRLGTELGVTRATISRWEAGVRRPRGERLHAYVSLLAELERVAA